MKYFEKYLKVAPLSHALWRAGEAEAVSKIIIRPPVLDIGCGFAEFAGVFFERIVEIGIDINKKDLAMADKNKKYKKLFFADARSLPFKNNTFNTVISISTLEHIKNVEKVFPEVFRVLKSKGTLIFTVPTITLNQVLTIPKQLKKLKLEFLVSLYVQFFHKVFKHIVVIHKEKWLKMVKKAGFRIIKVKGTISKNQVMIYELGLPLALPTQIFRFLTRKRLIISPKFRVSILKFLFNNSFKNQRLTDASIMVVAQKS